MSDTIEQNRWRLRRLCKAGQVFGWTLVAFFCVWLGLFLLIRLFGLSYRAGAKHLEDFTRGTTDWLLTGLVALGAVQLIQYLAEKDPQPGFLLRRGHLILWAFALGVLLSDTLELCSMTWFYQDGFETVDITLSLVSWAGILPTLAKALILFGIGLAIRLVMPIIAESKTLDGPPHLP